MILIEIQVVTFFWKTSRALTVNTDVDVVVKFSVMKQRGSSAKIGVGHAGVFHEQVNHGQLRLDGRVMDYQTQVSC